MKEKFEKEQKDNYIEDPMLDMPDMEDDEKFRQWLEETYIDEAELIEKSLLAGQEYEKNLDIVEELSVPREKFYQRLKEEGLYEDETEADESAETLDENLEISAESAETLKKMDGVSLAEETAETKTTGGKIISMEERASKVAGGAAKATSDKIIDMETRSSKEAGTAARATEGFNSPVKTETVAVSDIGVSSKKGSKNDRPVRKKRSYFIRGLKYLSGDDTRVVVGNDEDNEDVNTDEYEAIEDIENKIGVEVPEFYYRPKKMKFYAYTVDEPASLARIEYEYADTMILLFIDKQNENTASNVNVINGEEKVVDVISNDGIDITIKEIIDKGEELSTYSARWRYKSVEYYLMGKFSEEELKNIVKYMKF